MTPSGDPRARAAGAARAFSAGGDLAEFDDALRADAAQWLADLHFNRSGLWPGRLPRQVAPAALK